MCIPSIEVPSSRGNPSVAASGTNSGLRRGELLSLQWRDIRVTTTPTGLTKQALILKAENTKTNGERVVPVSQRLATVLTMRRHAPDGKESGQPVSCSATPSGKDPSRSKKVG